MTSRMARSSRLAGVTRILCGISVLAMSASGCGADRSAREVTAYVSADRPFSEPIMQEYQRRTGVRVNVVYDTEETKSTGLANRLLAEKERPQADVFWSNEPVRTLVLKSRGVLAAYQSPAAQDIADTFKDRDGYWTGFSARLRVIVYNTTKWRRPTPRGRCSTWWIHGGRGRWRSRIRVSARPRSMWPPCTRKWATSALTTTFEVESERGENR